MWIKLAIGAIVGLVLGSFLAPGYAFWVVLGIIAGYLTEVWLKKRSAAKQEANAADS